ncbi:signal recognition particle-docking protein FtsY [Bianquea renquensis]|uniref:Signal recognition particle receptor FtsY n=1 Tax=Bianquea renquensis TaxID=2763661 RepID=A0A926DTM4_9FIRM|nr:signal recognition particle-docking protein FtsY [Bianquea renquensis]MBC8543075.1 signal recognition particle-docking protein FtsY [Bianquea renquensis]
MGFFDTLKKGLEKTRNSIVGNIESLFGAYDEVDDDFYEELEEALILSDLGMETTVRIVESLRKKAREQRLKKPEEVRELLVEEIAGILKTSEPGIIEAGKMNVILVIGVNGVGKTTSIGKIAAQLKSEGNKVLLAAADTFRAAAIDQLKVWAQRADVDIIYHQEGADPGAVVFDAAAAARSRKADVLICDTAGRLHNKKNLMEELKKMNRILDREFPDAHREVLLVLDATTGQNALQQAKLFAEAAPITGIVLTKLDGTAKGGVVIGIAGELKIPVKYIGVGEGIEDLQPFRAEEFAAALFE